jgi:sugar phosphate isomerase/epimerase
MVKIQFNSKRNKIKMSFRDYMRLGVNHHLLYADVIKDSAEHLRTLEIVLSDHRLDIIDMWYPWDIKEACLKAIKDSGKIIYYNMGNRAGQRSLAPASMDDDHRRYTLDVYKDELKRAKLCNAQKIITNSGPNDLKHREKCKDYLVEFYIEICKQAEGIMVIIEPTDWDTSKYKLIGSSLEAVEICRRVRDAGCENMGSMIDMCHVPLMHETIFQAVSDTGEYLEHIHLGNCVLDKKSPWYGDKHPGLGIEGGIFGVSDIAELFKRGLSTGYFSLQSRGSASIEMRRLPGQSSEECFDNYYDEVCQAWDMTSMNQ